MLAPSTEPMPEVPAPETLTPSTVPVTAAKRLGLDITVPWPGAAEALRRLFATQLPVSDAPDESLARDESPAPDESPARAGGFTYVSVPMPAGSGYSHSLAGLQVQDGQIIAIRHALPALRAPEPPAGMESAAWVPGDGENGFWVTEEAL